MRHSAILTREPVVNQKRCITANRLIVHANDVADASDTLNALEAFWPTQHTVFVSLAEHTPDPSLLQWQAPDNTMIEIPVRALADPQTTQLLPELSRKGLTPCLRGWPDRHSAAAASHWRFVLAEAPHGSAPPDASAGIPIACGLPDLNAFEAAIEQGFAGASGCFFLNGHPPPQKLRPGHAQIIRLLNLARNDADVREIEDLLKQNVAISYKLLRYINSSAFGLRCEIQSFGHAVSILGYDNLNKWLSLLLVNAGEAPDAPALMQTSITRGRFMETIGADYFNKAGCDNLFITGAFSILPLLLGVSMQTLVDEMSLPESIIDALLHDRGEYAPFLRMARHTEGGNPSALLMQAGELQLSKAQINCALLRAVSFADSLAAE